MNIISIKTPEDIRKVEFLLGSKVIVVDIETDTAAPEWFGSGYGLSYNADITWIAMYAPGWEIEVVFDMRSGVSEIREFVKDILSRPDLTIVGHNVVFDLRALGGHYGFTLPLSTKVWDTLTIAILLLMGSAGSEQLSLGWLARRYKLILPEETKFLEFKDLRSALHTLPDEEVLEYVLTDVRWTYRLFQLQKQIIAASERADIDIVTDVDDGRFDLVEVNRSSVDNRFFSTKGYKNLDELVDWELRISRWCANAAIHGIRLDTDYVSRHHEQLNIEFFESVRAIFARHNEALQSEKEAGLMWAAWYDMIVKSVESGRVTKLNPERFVYLKLDERNRFSPDKYVQAAEHAGSLRDYNLLGGPPKLGEVSFNFLKWVEDHLNTDSFTAQRVVDWYRAYFSMTKPIEDVKLVNKKLFIQYYVLYLCKTSLPTSEDIAHIPALVTPKIKGFVENGQPVDLAGKVEWDYQTAAKNFNAFSFSVDAIEFFINGKHGDLDGLTHIHTVLEHAAKIRRIEEFQKHSQRDGRIHSIIARKTRTGRATSTSMNLQNIRVKTFKGYLIADSDEHVLIGLDVSNAENYFAALTSGDDRLAYACCSGDFHMQNTKVYWPEQYAGLVARIESGDETAHDELADLRKRSKFVTFASAYGAGAAKIATLIRGTVEEAQEILTRRDLAFPDYTATKQRKAELAQRAYAAGARPAFTTLWTGRRIEMPVQRGTDNQIAGYKAINYQQQGGVGELIWRAIVLVDEMLTRERYDARVVSQVHDELIISTNVNCAFEVAQRVCQIIANVVPEELRNRTTPATRFLSDLSPENAKKWGYRDGIGYPLPTDKYVNQWGVHDMPSDGSDAPIWINAENTTVDEELDRFRNKALSHTDSSETTESAETPSVSLANPYTEFQLIYSSLISSVRPLFERSVPGELQIDGKSYGFYNYPGQLAVMQELLHKGHITQDEYFEHWNALRDFAREAEKYIEWIDKNDPLSH